MKFTKPALSLPQEDYTLKLGFTLRGEQILLALEQLN
jgi:hypothetical protein